MEQRKIFNQDNAKTLGILFLVGGIGFAGYKTLQFFNLVPDQEDRDAAKLEKLFDKWGNPDYPKAVIAAYKKKSGKTIKFTMDSSKINPIVKKLHDAKGFFDDNEDALYTIFRNITTQIEFWKINFIFNQKYSLSVIDFLGFLDSAEKTKIYNIVKVLPAFKLGK